MLATRKNVYRLNSLNKRLQSRSTHDASLTDARSPSQPKCLPFLFRVCACAEEIARQERPPTTTQPNELVAIARSCYATKTRRRRGRRRDAGLIRLRDDVMFGRDSEGVQHAAICIQQSKHAHRHSSELAFVSGDHKKHTHNAHRKRTGDKEW